MYNEKNVSIYIFFINLSFSNNTFFDNNIKEYIEKY